MTASVLLALLLASRTPARADEAPPSHVEAQLWRETDWIEPGKPLTVAVRLVPKDGWHTYWRNPGDSGMATRLQWKLPPGFEAGPISWPRPERIVLPHVVDFGYRAPHSLLVELKTPSSISDDTVALSVKVKWLECLEACVPGEAELEMRVPVKAAPPLTTTTQRSLFQEARAALPSRLGEGPFAGSSASAARSGGSVELRLEPAPKGAKAEFFPYDNGAVANEARQASKLEDGALVLRLRPSPDSAGGRLSGVLALGPHGPAAEIDVPIQEK